MLNKAGWNAVKEVINIGGGSATIEFALGHIYVYLGIKYHAILKVINSKINLKGGN